MPGLPAAGFLFALGQPGRRYFRLRRAKGKGRELGVEGAVTLGQILLQLPELQLALLLLRLPGQPLLMLI
nr:Uncharacterised protein [Raoultella sp. NCTC 9187]